MSGVAFESRTLHFFWQHGCPACEEATPELDLYMRLHPFDIALLRRNIAYRHVIGEWKPEASPTYAITINRELVKTHVGPLRADELERFVNNALADAGDDEGADEPGSGTASQPEAT